MAKLEIELTTIEKVLQVRTSSESVPATARRPQIFLCILKSFVNSLLYFYNFVFLAEVWIS